MAGSGQSLREGLRPGLGNDGDEPAGLEQGYGTPTHVSPTNTVYVKLDATQGTSSHFRRKSDGTWAAMSDD